MLRAVAFALLFGAVAAPGTAFAGRVVVLDFSGAPRPGLPRADLVSALLSEAGVEMVPKSEYVDDASSAGVAAGELATPSGIRRASAVAAVDLIVHGRVRKTRRGVNVNVRIWDSDGEQLLQRAYGLSRGHLKQTDVRRIAAFIGEKARLAGPAASTTTDADSYADDPYASGDDPYGDASTGGSDTWASGTGGDSGDSGSWSTGGDSGSTGTWSTGGDSGSTGTWSTGGDSGTGSTGGDSWSTGGDSGTGSTGGDSWSTGGDSGTGSTGGDSWSTGGDSGTSSTGGDSWSTGGRTGGGHDLRDDEWARNRRERYDRSRQERSWQVRPPYAAVRVVGQGSTRAYHLQGTYTTVDYQTSGMFPEAGVTLELFPLAGLGPMAAGLGVAGSFSHGFLASQFVDAGGTITRVGTPVKRLYADVRYQVPLAPEVAFAPRLGVRAGWYSSAFQVAIANDVFTGVSHRGPRLGVEIQQPLFPPYLRLDVWGAITPALTLGEEETRAFGQESKGSGFWVHAALSGGTARIARGVIWTVGIDFVQHADRFTGAGTRDSNATATEGYLVIGGGLGFAY